MKKTALPAQLLGCLLICLFFVGVTKADEEEYQRVEVRDPYIELHTGPGAAYPIFHVVDRGELVELLKTKTDWFKVRTSRGKEGWVSREQIQQTLNPDGSAVALTELTRDSFNERRWEAGVMGGEFGGASVVSAYGAYAFTENLSVELSFSQALGNVSDSIFVNASIVNQPFPSWRYSPFFTIGTGTIRTNPNTTIVAADDRTDNMLNTGVGVRRFLGKRFLIRAEYKQYVVVTSRNENDDISEWKIGFSFFF